MTISCYLLGEMSYAWAVVAKSHNISRDFVFAKLHCGEMNHCLGKSGDWRPHKDSARCLLRLSDKTLNHTTFTGENIFRIR